MSPALADDGASALVALLVALLAMMLAAVIRLPEEEGPPGQDSRPQPAAATPSQPADPQARAAAAIARAEAVLGQVGGPPWGPASRPPGLIP